MQELDLLRFVAATAVVFYHYTYAGYSEYVTGAIAPLAAVFRYGYLGVELFFLISGFVILMSAEHYLRAGPFLIARLRRIYPTLWLGVTFTTVAIVAWNDERVRVTVWQFLANLTLLHRQVGQRHIDPVYWTLTLELRFYAVVALILFTGTLSRSMRWLVGWQLLCTGGLALGMVPKMLYWGSYFIGGCAFYRLMRGDAPRYLGWLLLVSAGTSIWQAVDYAAGLGRSPLGPVEPAVAGAVVAVLYGTFWLVTTRRLRLRLPVWLTLGLGGLTYPLYLIHQMAGYAAFDFLARRGVSYPVQLVVVLGAVYAVSYLIWRWYEPWARRLLRRKAITAPAPSPTPSGANPGGG